MSEQCLMPTIKFGKGSVMVWGCYAGKTVGYLDYLKNLTKNAVLSGRRIVSHRFVFQQNND